MDFDTDSNYTNYFTLVPVDTTDSGTTSIITLTGSQDLAQSWINSMGITPDENWMPYQYVEYEPKWHQKYARYKIQIEKMWD